MEKQAEKSGQEPVQENEIEIIDISERPQKNPEITATQRYKEDEVTFEDDISDGGTEYLLCHFPEKPQAEETDSIESVEISDSESSSDGIIKMAIKGADMTARTFIPGFDAARTIQKGGSKWEVAGSLALDALPFGIGKVGKAVVKGERVIKSVVKTEKVAQVAGKAEKIAKKVSIFSEVKAIGTSKRFAKFAKFSTKE